MENNSEIALPCDHCQDSIVIDYTLAWAGKEHHFCCQGCRNVFQILHENNLEKYYKLERESLNNPSPVKIHMMSFKYLDQDVFLEKYAIKTENALTLSFYLEGIHCVACLWLIEKLPEIISGVQKVKLNMGTSIAEVTIEQHFYFSEVAKKLNDFGYRPHPILTSQEAKRLSEQEDRSMLIKIGISFACAGNIMLLAIANYAGAEGIFASSFNLISLCLATPVVFFSAIPFYKNAFFSLRRKEISLDIPIVLAIILAYFSGLYHVIIGQGEVYFDSVSALVFLLLFARYVMKKAGQHGLGNKEVSHFFANQSAVKIENGIKNEVHTSMLRPGDTIFIAAGEIIPADGPIIQGQSSLNNSLLTGESRPVSVKMGDIIYAGCQNLDHDLIIKVDAIQSESRLGKIIKEVESGWGVKAPIILAADQIGKYFVSIVLVIATCVFIYGAYHFNLQEAFSRALGLIIVTCPCALGLATPLAMTLSLNLLSKLGIIVKNEEVIEKAARAQKIYLDKTGTLTYGQFQVYQFLHLKDLDNKILSVIFSMEGRSKHPVAIAIREFIKQYASQVNLKIEEVKLDHFTEHLGRGVECYFEGKKYSLQSASANEAYTTIALSIDDRELATIKLKDTIRPQAFEVIKKLKALRLDVSLISGDNEKVVSEIGDQLQIAKSHLFFEATPEKKREIINKSSEAIMIGDGANDALALSSASVGVAVKGSVDISLRASDVYLSKPEVNLIFHLVEISQETLKLIYRNLSFSLLYNIAGAALAITGYITPLWAAILMPISSLSVLFSTLLSTKRIRQTINMK